MPNNIGQVEITDKKAPLIVLFGPPSCGKTMTLIRLTRYLRNIGMTVTPDRSFRPSDDMGYKNDCDRFNQTVNNPMAAPGTPPTGYMLVDVIEGSKVLCKILEAPGELYFDPQDPNKEYPLYLHTIKNAPNRKVWCAFVEPNWGDATIRVNYVSRISAIKPLMEPKKDKMIFIFNKIDKINRLIKAPGIVDEKGAINYVSNNYPGIFDSFKNNMPISSFFKPYICFFQPFQTGDYSESTDANQNRVLYYSPGTDKFPAQLWSKIRKII